jgi:protoporphyrin/coproporphyrin ferrochelatase
MPYDALLLVSFGGPEGPDDVIPFLEHVTRGRGVPRERLTQVGEHYFRFGGVSPINGQCRALVAAIESDLAAHGLEVPVYWGNRNWHPFLADTLRRMTEDGVRRAAVVVTAAYSSYSCCRQYTDDIERARAAVEAMPGTAAPPRIERVRKYFNHPGFVRPFVEHTVEAIARLPEPLRAHAPLVFTAHSIPLEQPGRAAYVAELTDLARVVTEAVRAEIGGYREHAVVYQSRSGRPGQPWLEPDVGEHLERLHADGVGGAVAVPIGFVSDHMEIVYDLDVEAAERAAKLGLALTRAATPGTHPRFVAMVRELLLERGDPDAPRPALGDLGPAADDCAAPCCRARSASPSRPAGAAAPRGGAA